MFMCEYVPVVSSGNYISVKRKHNAYRLFIAQRFVTVISMLLCHVVSELIPTDNNAHTS